MKKLIALFIVVIIFLTGCSAADVASQNLSTAADNFEISRRIVFYNGITDTYMLTIEGKCSLGNNDPAKELSVTCKTSDNTYVKYFLGLSDNVTYFSQQLEGVAVNDFHYRVLIRPEVILPSIELK